MALFVNPGKDWEKRSFDNMKKALSICLFLSLMAGCLLTGCGSNTTDDSSSVAETTAATTATEAETTAESETEETEAETETTAEESSDAEDAETTTAAKEKDTSKDENLWADFDNMSFKINGKTYTLGKTTLQEMIDDGVPFDENDFIVGTFSDAIPKPLIFLSNSLLCFFQPDKKPCLPLKLITFRISSCII